VQPAVARAAAGQTTGCRRAFDGTGRNQKVLLLEKRPITQRETVFELVVDQQPTHAGIDPYNKLIDRDSDDNIVPVKRGG